MTKKTPGKQNSRKRNHLKTILVRTITFIHATTESDSKPYLDFNFYRFAFLVQFNDFITHQSQSLKVNY